MSTEDGESETATEARRIGRYELSDPLGPASYGGIYRAKVRSGSDTGRQVVARVVERGGLDAASVELLSSAGFSAMEVRDPRLAAVLDVVVEDEALAVISEWLDGARLRDILHHAAQEDTACPLPVAVRIALDLIDALQASKKHWHDIYPASEDPSEATLRAVVHGGVVPDSVVVATFGETMLCEAGVSGAAMTVEALRDSVVALCLRAPEQLNHPADERADVFSVGVVLWELIAGRSLFGASAVSRRGVSGAVSLRAGSPVAAMKRKLEGGAITRLETLPKLKDKVPKALSTVVARATDRDAKLRYVTLEELKKALTGLDIEPASVESVASYLVAVSGTPAAVTDHTERASNRPTKPPDEGDEEDRETAVPASLDVPPPPEEIASLAPEAPDDADVHAVDFASMVAAADRHAPPPPDGAGVSGAVDDEPLPSEPGIDLLADDDDEDEAPSSPEPAAVEDAAPPSDRAPSPRDEEEGEVEKEVAAVSARGDSSASPTVKRSSAAVSGAKATAAEESSSSRVPFVIAAAVLVGVLVWVVSSADGDPEPEPSTPAAAAPGPAPPRSKAAAPVADDPLPTSPATVDASAPVSTAALEAETEEDPDRSPDEAEPTPVAAPGPGPNPGSGPRPTPKPRAGPKKKVFRPDDI